MKYCGTAEKPSDQKRKQTSTYGIGKSGLFGSSYHLFCLSSGERTKMEVDIKGYPRVHTHYLSIKKDLDRLNKLLDQTRIQYQNALNKAQCIPFRKRFSHFVVSLVSLGLVPSPDPNIEIEKEKVKIHRTFCPLIEKINSELFQVSKDFPLLEKLDHQYTINLGIGLRLNGYPSDWEELSKAVRERDGYRCNYCGSPNLVLQTHHVIPLSRGGSNAMSNLTTLCEKCHRAKHPHMKR